MLTDYDEVNMENYAVNLQDKIQKLIDQYTSAKKKIEELEMENSLLADQNIQLISQIEDSQKNNQAGSEQMKALEARINELVSEQTELKTALAGFENIASDAISKIDVIFPELDEL